MERKARPPALRLFDRAVVLAARQREIQIALSRARQGPAPLEKPHRPGPALQLQICRGFAGIRNRNAQGLFWLAVRESPLTRRARARVLGISTLAW